MPAKYKQESDPELVALCLQGDPLAWEALVQRYKRLIYSVPVRFNLASADAADVFQSTCLALIEHLHELRDERRLSSWIITTATRYCIRFRVQKFRAPEAEEEDFDDSIDPGGDLEQVRLQIEERQAVRESVELLPDRCRELIALLYFDSRVPNYEKVAQVLSIPVSSIGPSRARCLEKLRAILRRRGIK
jgi:RNA polymerase sigma factor (sigma-70 family)